jgi:hypothetical protein
MSMMDFMFGISLSVLSRGEIMVGQRRQLLRSLGDAGGGRKGRR